MATVIVPAADQKEATGGAFGIKAFAWAIFEWARNPYYNVVVISVFAPYFASQVVDNGAQGQALVARTILIAGLIMAITAPILGALTDNGGRKKPALFFVLATIAICSLGLWFVVPERAASVPLGMALMATAYCAYTVSELLHNSMLSSAGKSESLPLISGLGIGLGNIAGVVVLGLMFALSSNPGLLGLEGVPGGVQRAGAVFVAIWLCVFIIPFFLFMPDDRPEGATWTSAFKQMFMGDARPDPIGYVREKFKEYPNVMRYLVARMIYADGVAALLTIGAVYVSGVLDWSVQEVTLFGIVGAIFGAVGGLTGGWLDRWLGPKKALVFELSMISILLVVQLSVTPTHALFGLVPADVALHDGDLFPTLADQFYFLTVIPAGIFIGASITSSRYMLLHISPPEKLGEFFGFYAMAGSVTVWLGPGLVDLMTTVSGDQRIGMTGVMFLFFIGLALLLTVDADKTPNYLREQVKNADLV